jgi:aspartyl-tRNA(Asn)/glutamyl-tRNA(Gln) amidotransferase subunit B
VGAKYFNERCEIKNMVSFKFIKSAIEYEARRQIEILENGGTIERNTMRYHPDDGITTVMRSKEDALDYRYFPDPDLLELEITDEDIERIRKTMPELPTATRARYINEYGLSEYDASRLTETVDISHWYDAAVDGNVKRAKPIANWLISELFAHPENMDIENKITENSDPDAPRIITPANLSELVDMIASNEINGKQAKDIFIKMLDGERGTIHEIADKYGMKQITDTSAIESAVDDVIKNNPAQVEQYKSGKVGLLGFFVGNVMKATKGQANPAVVNEILRNKLN